MCRDETCNILQLENDKESCATENAEQSTTVMPTILESTDDYFCSHCKSICAEIVVDTLCSECRQSVNNFYL
jgi:hypothetical protein